ncbi:bifunctional coenzyme A synthase-like [Mytilus edulis]|uniref:bifunctional coenzyme A synthase-like n=1 Tax=Mytilus edulis TaxID=6550 RepID=UPI0039F130EF
MYKTGLLILTRPLPVLKSAVQSVLEEAATVVSNTLYVHIQPSSSSDTFKIGNVPCSKDFRCLMTQLYSSSASLCNNLDVRILLNNVSNLPLERNLKFDLKRPCDIVLIDNQLIADEFQNKSKSLASLMKDGLKGPAEVHTLSMPADSQSSMIEDDKVESFDNVVLGGTFDRLHAGHKIMLSEACFLAERQITVGVTDENMNRKKTLCELITPTEKRIEGVLDFLQDIKPCIEHKVVAINDMFGPTISDPDLQFIVVSEETKRGGEIVNEERQKKGFTVLKQHVIELVVDSCHNQYEEEKISSSSSRKRLLGTVINPIVPNRNIPSSPYVIGLTGGIASGKSALCGRLEKLGAGIVDCDKLGHEVYLNGTPCYNILVEQFGDEIVGKNGEIQRRALGSIVFSNPEKLQLLNRIVWPEIGKFAEDKIKKHAENGKEIVVLEAALLLDAGWNNLVHEVWTSVVPPEEAVKRMMDRNNMTEEEANKRLKSQLSNKERVQRSNVVLCTLWEYEYTQTQVEKAWSLLQKRLTERNSEHSKY